MSIGMMGQKIGMTQIFSKEGIAIPVTILQVGPCIVTNIQNYKTYQSIQIGYQTIKPTKLNKPQIGYFNKLGMPCLKYLQEYKTYSKKEIEIGKTLTVKEFQIGNIINVSGTSIGKGFSGYQKKHHFSRGPMSHGSKNHRQPGSIGAGTTPGRVFPGKRMAGRLGGKKTTIKNLQIIGINLENHLIIIKGSVPGKTGNLIKIYKQEK
uniref:Large ribosomal subunit protein uL3c n=1 Tax=Sphondylothamnion multifidum TaxID=193186 RepID=A0A4D6X212_9FLOR|nr:ribosomal protein L3 [Sphondylothamnion multifidum]